MSATSSCSLLQGLDDGSRQDALRNLHGLITPFGQLQVHGSAHRLLRHGDMDGFGFGSAPVFLVPGVTAEEVVAPLSPFDQMAQYGRAQHLPITAGRVR